MDGGGLVLLVLAAVELCALVAIAVIVVAGRRRSAAGARSEAVADAHARDDLERRERLAEERTRRLDEQFHELEERGHELTGREAALAQDRSRLVEERADLEIGRQGLVAERAALEAERLRQLEAVAGLGVDEARTQVLATAEQAARHEAAVLARDIEREARRTAEATAREVAVGAVQRLATEATTESVVSVVQLPGDDMKGRIIGREGRNIRCFEQVTGVNLVIDDTPEAVLLSCFDPVRREVARSALEALVLDGRIHPQRIEDAVEKARVEIDALCQRAAEDAVIEARVSGVHPELMMLLGRLRFRTSYGQNVLRHLVETAHLAGLMAAELGMDPALARRCGLLHDVGKALTHEVEGTHAMVGAEVARRCGESADVVHAIEAHHEEVEPRTVVAVLTQAADAVSGGRPGARRESLESYVARLHRLEEIAAAHKGVDKVYAMQSGRDVRVMVQPEVVDDMQAQVLAREIAKQVETELTYPGQIRVTVVRESRATEVAR